jgi:hypothetical protein
VSITIFVAGRGENSSIRCALADDCSKRLSNDRRNVEQGRQKQLASLLKGLKAQERAAAILALMQGFKSCARRLG